MGKDIEEISLAIIVARGIHFLLVCLLFIHLTHSGTKKSKKNTTSSASKALNHTFYLPSSRTSAH